MMTELVLGGGVIALMLLAGGGAGGPISDKERDDLWNALCVQWRNNADPPKALENAIVSAGLTISTTLVTLAEQFWKSIETRSGGDRSMCPPAPWAQPTPAGPSVVIPVPGGGGSNIVTTLGEYTKRAPAPNSLYQVTKGVESAGISGVARKVVGRIPGAKQTGQNRTVVMKAIAMSKWNLPYRMPRAPAFWTVTDGDVTWDVRGAFFPANVNAKVAIVQGNLPRRNLRWATTAQKTGAGSSYGLLYIPEFSQVDGDVVSPSGGEDAAGMLPVDLMDALGKTSADIVP